MLCEVVLSFLLQHNNMFGVTFVMWFDLSIEAKSTMDREEEDWGGIIEFGFSAKSFSKYIEDYFLLMEDECSTHSHNCGRRVRGVVLTLGTVYSSHQVMTPEILWTY